MKTQLTYIEEPKLEFGEGQLSIDPRDGLLLYGPYEKLEPFSVRAGVVGTLDGLKDYSSFVETLQKPIISKKLVYGKEQDDQVQRPSFPGFKAVFNVDWSSKPEFFCEISDNKVKLFLSEKNKKIRTRNFVDLYIDLIKEAINEEDASVSIWFIVVPREVYLACRPNSKGRSISKGTKDFIKHSDQGQLSLLGDDDYIKTVKFLEESSSDFHNLLKAELIHRNIQAPVQIIVDSTLQFREKLQRKRYEDSMRAHIAWTQSTTLYYKLGKLPWRLYTLRSGVCYVGLVFKQMENKEDNVCSAAQMFLKDGDGSVFRGNIGLWKAENKFEYHLNQDSAKVLIGMALDDYYKKWKEYPKELFIHGRAKFDNNEWAGFENAVKARGAETKLCGVIIKDSRSFKSGMMKLFKTKSKSKGNYGNIRGLGYALTDNKGYLFTRGFIPRLNTSNAMEIPNPLYVEISNQSESVKIEQVFEDILALTKLNYNSCLFADGLPVTLRFSDNIGSILTATENWESEIRQFRYYI